MVKGIWNGIKDATGWILDIIRGFGSSVLNGIKSVFGIHSPSTLFRDEIGTNLALGLGEGFSDTMSDVTKEMQSAIPTEFDTNVNMKSSSSSMGSSYDNMVNAFKKALTDVKVVMNDREFGTFVSDTMEGLVYS
jgi:phage-related protein